MPRHTHQKPDPGQLEFDWSEASLPPRGEVNEKPSERPETPTQLSPTQTSPPPLVQVLPWDFRLTFPQPLEAAIEAGVLHDEDREPENIKSLHVEHAREALATLADLDALTEARRFGVDPVTGKKPRTEKQKENLKRKFAEEPPRLEHAFETLMDVYEEAFGKDATDAFRKAIRAWHAGVDVVSETRPVFPPLDAAVCAGVFGQDEDGSVVNPSLEEVDEITAAFVDRLTDRDQSNDVEQILASFAEDFGPDAAKELKLWMDAKERAEDNEFVWPPGHPWHYYQEGDGADPIPVNEIDASDLSSASEISLPKDRARRIAKLSRMIADAERQLAEDKKRYIELADKGIDALSERDRNLGASNDAELNWATAIALKYNHIRYGLGRIQALREVQQRR